MEISRLIFLWKVVSDIGNILYGLDFGEEVKDLHSADDMEFVGDASEKKIGLAIIVY